MKCVSHKQASQLLHNKFIVVLGDSIHRSIYKDLVMLVQKDKYLSIRQLRNKGEMSFEQDCLVEGGCLGQMHNGTEYREVRQFRSAHHLVRFYFVTRIYSRYMRSVLADFRRGLKPDVVIVNSCVWDISRYNYKWLHNYKENLHEFFDELKTVLPEETLVIWNLTMPLAENIKGGFLVPEIEHKAPQLRYDVVEANFYSGTLANAYGMDVLDLHFLFRFSLHHRTKDGVHWNAIAHRMISSLLLQHIAQAWGVILTSPTLTPIEYTEVPVQQPAHNTARKLADWHSTTNSYGGNGEEFSSDALPSDYLSFEEDKPEPKRSRCKAPPPYRRSTVQQPAHSTAPMHADWHPTMNSYNGNREQYSNDALPSDYLSFEENKPKPRRSRCKAPPPFRQPTPPLPTLPVYSHPYGHHGSGICTGFAHDHRPPHYNPHRDHQFVMRSRYFRYHYGPYPHHRTIHHDYQSYFY